MIKNNNNNNNNNTVEEEEGKGGVTDYSTSCGRMELEISREVVLVASQHLLHYTPTSTFDHQRPPRVGNRTEQTDYPSTNRSESLDSRLDST